MPHWLAEQLPWWLTALFSAHFIPFLILSVRRKTWRYLSTLLTFGFLVLLNIFKGLSIDPDIAGLSGQFLLRSLAILFAGITLVLFIKRRVQK
jgi:hypothetical protein